MPTELSDGLGKSIGDLIEGDVKIGKSGAVTGTLKAVTGYTGFSGTASEQSGHYLPLKLNAKYGGQSISVQRNGKAAKVSTDLEWILRVPSNSTTFEIKANDSPVITLNFTNATLA